MIVRHPLPTGSALPPLSSRPARATPDMTA